MCDSAWTAYLVPSMQENAVHGWRVQGAGHFKKGGRPAKIKNFAWVGATPFFAISGADEVLCWRFDGKDGPKG